MHFVVFGTHRDETGQAREALAGAFADYVGDQGHHPDVTVHHGGPTLSEDGETVNGLLLVIEAPSPTAARAFLDRSPYGQADLLAECQVRPWRWLTGRPD